ncbi:MAG: stage V sporulation protein AD [Clostridia bacterium]
MGKHIGQTMFFENAIIKNGYTVAGPKEQDGRLKDRFDESLCDDKCGENSFEKAERDMFRSAIKGTADKGNMSLDDIDTIIGGDLLNQIISTSFAVRDLNCSFTGLYNACATYVESMIIGSAFISSGFKDNVICVAGSHFSTAERQYRYPLELGVLRSPESQWTATGVGATLLTTDNQNNYRKKIYVTSGVFGRVVDFGISDVNNMGAAMAPAAVNTLMQYFNDTGYNSKDFDIIATGDLGYLGMQIFMDLMQKNGYPLGEEYMDCGASLYYDKQQTYQGGSGAAASALVFNSTLLDRLKKGSINRMLLIGTGALMSPLTAFQGESIPVIAHLIEVQVK